MATDYGVRQGLKDAGYADDDIGYDQNSGYVQVKGQNFIKPEMNVDGTTYTSQGNFNNALNQYRRSQQQQQAQQLTNQYVQQATSPQPTKTPFSGATQQLTNQYLQQISHPQEAVNPYANQLTQMIADIQQRMNAPQQDVYATPQYTAAQAQTDKRAQEAKRAAQESLGSSGFGRSTALGQTVQQGYNDANEYLATQLVPQIQQQLAAQKQADISNQFGLLNPVMGLLNRQDTQERNKQTDLSSALNFLYGREDQQSNKDQSGMQNLFNVINLLNGREDQSTVNDMNKLKLADQSTVNDMNKLKLENYPKEVEQAAKLFDQQYRTGDIDLQTRDFNLQQLKDPESPVNKKNQIELQIAQMNLENMPEESKLRLEQLRKQIAQIGAAPYRSPEQVQMDKVKLQTAEEELKNLQDPTSLENRYKQSQIDVNKNKPEVPNKPTPVPAKDSADNYTQIITELDDIDGLTAAAAKSKVTVKQMAQKLAAANKEFLSDADYRKLLDKIETKF